jgi:hypothetical protein
LGVDEARDKAPADHSAQAEFNTALPLSPLHGIQRDWQTNHSEAMIQRTLVSRVHFIYRASDHVENSRQESPKVASDLPHYLFSARFRGAVGRDGR